MTTIVIDIAVSLLEAFIAIWHKLGVPSRPLAFTKKENRVSNYSQGSPRFVGVFAFPNNLALKLIRAEYFVQHRLGVMANVVIKMNVDTAIC